MHTDEHSARLLATGHTQRTLVLIKSKKDMNQKVDLKTTPWINKPDHRQVSEETFFLF